MTGASRCCPGSAGGRAARMSFSTTRFSGLEGRSGARRPWTTRPGEMAFRGSLFWTRMEMGHYQKALELGQQALACVDEQEGSLGKAHLLFLLALLYGATGSYLEAEQAVTRPSPSSRTPGIRAWPAGRSSTWESLLWQGQRAQGDCPPATGHRTAPTAGAGVCGPVRGGAGRTACRHRRGLAGGQGMRTHLSGYRTGGGTYTCRRRNMQRSSFGQEVQLLVKGEG